MMDLARAQRTMWQYKPQQSGDYAWVAILTAAIIYELVADDLLSEATERYYGKHPVVTRWVILAIAGHLAGVLPPVIDIFSAKNVLHRGIVRASHIDRSKREPDQIFRSKRAAHRRPQTAC